MKKPAILVTDILPSPVLRSLKKHFNLSLNHSGKPLTKPALINRLRNKEGVIAMLSNTFDQEVLQAARALKIISNYAVGYNNIDLAEARKRSVTVTNTPGVLTEATADLTWALILSVARRVIEGDRLVRNGKWKGWAPTQLLGQDLTGKTIGIIGMGRIGRSVARRALGFGMKIIYKNRSRLPVKTEKAFQARAVSLKRLLHLSDVISLHTPLTPQTRHMIGSREFSMMKRTCLLINTSRGPVIDEQSLVRALDKRKIAGAGLDVYEREPALAPGLSKRDNAVLLPHLGSAAVETRINMGWVVQENLRAFFSGKKPPNRIV